MLLSFCDLFHLREFVFRVYIGGSFCAIPCKLQILYGRMCPKDLSSVAIETLCPCFLILHHI